MSNTTLTFLLTERRRFSGQKLHANIAKVLGQADKLPILSEGKQAQLERHISILPRNGWPTAALTRQLDAKDAELNSWLRADPAHVRAEMGVVRLLACGDLGLTQTEADELIKPLKILFGDIGFPLSAPNPARWYLMLPKESKLPVFVSPDEAIGADIFSVFPPDDSAKRWRTLLNEAQITLHNHPLNAERIQKGLLPVNSLYFWGGGALPDHQRLRPDSPVPELRPGARHHAAGERGARRRRGAGDRRRDRPHLHGHGRGRGRLRQHARRDDGRDLGQGAPPVLVRRRQIRQGRCDNCGETRCRAADTALRGVTRS